MTLICSMNIKIHITSVMLKNKSHIPGDNLFMGHHHSRRMYTKLSVTYFEERVLLFCINSDVSLGPCSLGIVPFSTFPYSP